MAVNVDPSESDVVSLTAVDLNTNLEGTDVMVVNSEAELAAVIEDSRVDRSWWRYFMIGGLIFLAIECLFADRIQNRKKKQGKQKDLMSENLTGEQDA